MPGKDGLNGAPGKDGSAGKDGLPGKDGLNGSPGTPGKDGVNGADGKAGTNGKDGLPGKDGAAGKDGVNGNDGLPGKDGVSGKDGVNGTPGTNGVNGKDGTISAGTATSPARAFNSTFQPSATKTTLAMYAIRIVSTSTLLGSALGRVELRSDTNTPPTTVRSRMACGVSGVGATNTNESTLTYLVPPGHNVNLTTVNESGTPTYTLVSVTEITF